MLKRKARRSSRQIALTVTPIIQKGFGYEMPPEFPLVHIYFDQEGRTEEATPFYNFYRNAGWCGPQGRPHRNWKVLAAAWLKKLRNINK